MINSKLKTQINVLLLVLVVLDAGYALTAFFAPEMWFDLIHGTPYEDPQGLFRRTGAIWLAFAVFQLVAFFRWQKQPHWIAVIAGVRATEIFADWFYLFFAQDITGFGQGALLLATPLNIVVSWFFFRSYARIEQATREVPATSKL